MVKQLILYRFLTLKLVFSLTLSQRFLRGALRSPLTLSSAQLHISTII
ncbi:hypothetical protein [Dolichospermum compactum]|nr:hypothetical protein [Dolichospermum compactum]